MIKKFQSIDIKIETTVMVLLLVFVVLSVKANVYQFPLKVSADSRYLEDQAGTPFLYNADTGWKLFNKLEKEEVLEYLSDRKNKKFTVIQTMLTGFAGEKNTFGNPPFHNLNDFETLNEDYFKHVDWVIRQADSMNLILAIAPLWVGCCGEGYSGKDAYMTVNGPEKALKFGQIIGDKYKAYSNIIWIIGGDNDPHEDRENMRQLAMGIKSQAPNQLMTYHAASSHSSTDVWGDEDWLDIVMTYTYFRGFDKAWNKNQPDVYEVNYLEYQKHPVKPFFLGESTYEGMHDSWGSALQARKQAYWSVLAGGMGHAYGTPMWDFPENWRDYIDLAGGNSLQYLYQLFHLRPWYQLVPDTLQKLLVAGAGEYASNDYAVAAIERNGRFLVAYIPSGRNLKLNVEGINSKALHITWINPANGNTTVVGKKRKKSWLELATPDQNDWLLVIDAADTNLPILKF